MNEDFMALALSMVADIPSGRVATYGQIARLVGYPNHARHVGRACRYSRHFGEYPCHRVVNSQGGLLTGWAEQRRLLEAEGVAFLANGKVDLQRCRFAESNE